MMTSELSRQKDCRQMVLEGLTLSAEDSPVSLSRPQENTRGLTITVISGRKCCELSQSVGLLGLLVRTLLTSSMWHSTKSSLVWRGLATKSGSHLSFRLVPSEPTIDEAGHGFVPTPTRVDYKGSVRKRFRGSPHYRSNLPEYLRSSVADGAYPNPECYEAIMGYPAGWTELKR